MAATKPSAEAIEAQISRILTSQDSAEKDMKLAEGYRKRFDQIETDMKKLVLDEKGITAHALVEQCIASGEACLVRFGLHSHTFHILTVIGRLQSRD